MNMLKEHRKGIENIVVLMDIRRIKLDDLKKHLDFYKIKEKIISLEIDVLKKREGYTLDNIKRYDFCLNLMHSLYNDLYEVVRIRELDLIEKSIEEAESENYKSNHRSE